MDGLTALAIGQAIVTGIIIPVMLSGLGKLFQIERRLAHIEGKLEARREEDRS